MIQIKQEQKPADIEAGFNRAEKEVMAMERPTKTEFIRILRSLKKMAVNYETPEQIEIPEFLRMERR